MIFLDHFIVQNNFNISGDKKFSNLYFIAGAKRRFQWTVERFYVNMWISMYYI